MFPGLVGLSAFVLLEWSARITPHKLVKIALVCWLVIKIVHVDVMLPHRLAKRHAPEKGEQLAHGVPDGRILYLFRLKDEGLMFYYGRPVVRLNALNELPFTQEGTYCILTAEEWRTWTGPPVSVVGQLQDVQGDAIVLVSLLPG